MSDMEAANLQILAKFHNAQQQWLVMRWNTLVSLSLLGTGQSLSSDETSKQLSLPGFPVDEKSPAP
jgi:hypothetical protein